MDFKSKLGLDPQTAAPILENNESRIYANLKLKLLGYPCDSAETEHSGLSDSFLNSYQEKMRLVSGHLPAVDQRIEGFMETYFSSLDPEEIPKLPKTTLILDKHGLARTYSLPIRGDHFSSDIVDSYRLKQGILNNPKSDRRTTKGVFHVAEGGLPIPNDKKGVPALTAARLISHAMKPPESLKSLPYMDSEADKAHTWVSLLLRPVVVPEVDTFTAEKSMEVRFFAPGNLISNLDFVESIFGNGGDPYLTENDSALDPEHWTGHTGCVILAPHLTTLTKKELGLPNIADATARQKRDGMCWEDPAELYNDGSAFKVTVRDASGIIVTAIADNYYGYCKKEVKTQISYAANLHGLVEEEHAGGTLAFTGYDLGEDFQLSRYFPTVDHSFKEVIEHNAENITCMPEGYAVDKKYPDILYVPQDAHFELDSQTITWSGNGAEQSIKLLSNRTYVLPSGYKVQLVKPAEGRRWRLVGHTAESKVCHKPCTVSGGGKSEISKSISDAMINGPVFVKDFESDFKLAYEITGKDFSQRFRDASKNSKDGRALLSSERSLGSVIKLLTPSQVEYNDAYNQWLGSIPQHVKEFVFIIKRYYKPDWGDDWQNRFSVALVNGEPGNILRYKEQPLITQYLRIGYTEKGAWRTFGLRKDFMPADKISLEDDITASVVVPASQLANMPQDWTAPSAKFVHNCEYRFFQRPDDAVIRGYDKQAEIDLSTDCSFISNYAPLDRAHAIEEIEDTIRFDHYTEPMQTMIQDFAAAESPDYYMSNAFPRIVDGTPTKNPRYLQVRPDLKNQRAVYLADMSTRLYRRQSASSALLRPVTSILPGRRNNPADPASGAKPLCVNNPIHYMELPELFMEFIASITGKSPSTTGAGSEGALTKAPFNALPPIYDLNNALVAYLATDQPIYITAAGYVGPHFRVDHDVSLLAPEIWCRLKQEETDPKFLIEHGYLEKVEDFEHNGEIIPASRIGYRITAKFVRIFVGRVFNNPDSVFSEEMLKPEKQDLETFVIGMQTIAAAHKQAALNYFEDGSIEAACPPLKALLNIMAYGEFEGKGIEAPEVRDLFTRKVMIHSDWYKARLQSQQTSDIKLWSRHVANLEKFLTKGAYASIAADLKIDARLSYSQAKLEKVSQPEYLDRLVGTIGRQPI